MSQEYQCPEGHRVEVDANRHEIGSEVTIDVSCMEHGYWMQPVPSDEVEP